MRWQVWSRTVKRGLTVQPRNPYCDACCKCNGPQWTVWRKANIICLRKRSNPYEFRDTTAMGDLEVIGSDRASR